MKQNDKKAAGDPGRDLEDPARDQERLQPDGATIDLPDVKDIPGQEFIHPPALGELADTTISSADEEGGDLLNDTAGDAYSLNKKDVSANDNTTQGNP